MRIKLAVNGVKRGIFVCLIGLTLPALVFAEDKCAQAIEGNDQMQFNLSSMEFPASCKAVKITLKHTGKLPINAMGHNWVLVKTADVNAVGMAGMSAGIDNDHVPQNDPRVLAATKLIGGGEETSVEFDISKLDPKEKYTYICTFPGHFSVMKGEFKIAA